MARTACLVCLVSTVTGRTKKALGRGSANSARITKLEQSRFSFNTYEKWEGNRYGVKLVAFKK